MAAVVGSSLLPLPQPAPRGEGDTLHGTVLDNHHNMHQLLAEPEEADTAVGDHSMMHRVVSGKRPDTAFDIRPLLVEKEAVVAVQIQTVPLVVVDSLAAVAVRKRALLHHR